MAVSLPDHPARRALGAGLVWRRVLGVGSEPCVLSSGLRGKANYLMDAQMCLHPCDRKKGLQLATTCMFKFTHDWYVET